MSKNRVVVRGNDFIEMMNDFLDKMGMNGAIIPYGDNYGIAVTPKEDWQEKILTGELEWKDKNRDSVVFKEKESGRVKVSFKDAIAINEHIKANIAKMK